MNKGGVKQPIALIALMLFGFASQTFAASDPFLTLDTVLQTNGQLQFNLNGESGVSYVIEGSSDLQNWAPLLTNNDTSMTRIITVDESQNFGFYRVSRGLLPIFSGAITVRSNMIVAKGNAVLLDSFDSSDTNDFPGGQWNAALRRDHGDVASGYGFVSLGNAKFMGKIQVRPGQTIANVGLSASGAVGDVSFVTTGGTGFESSDFFADDFRFCLPDVAVPFISGLPLPSTTESNILSSGQYFVDGDLGLFNSSVVGQALIYVTGNFSANGVSIQSDSSLTVFVGGGKANLGAINSGGLPAGFQYYGLPGNTNVSWAANTTVVGTVYSPEANVIIVGSTNIGAIVANSVTLVGNASVHYDENLAVSGPRR